ncbi:MAG: polysaccharide deacetylase family protein [Flavobacterium sp.]
MKLYWVKTGRIIKQLFGGYVWDLPTGEKVCYLTFDDGPTQEVTEFVLGVLAEHDIKATFFCIGNNIEKHPDIFQRVIAEGHTIANHTYNHLNGWKTDFETYMQNVQQCERSIADRHSSFKANKLFRPPYGKIRASQARAMRELGYRIIMWDVLSADFDQTITPQQCLQNVVRNVRPGSVIIFHDSVKAEANMRYALPRAIKILKENGYRFKAIAAPAQAQ